MQDLLDIVACPACKGRLSWSPNKSHLLCRQCQVMFPVREGIPVLLLDEAEPFEPANVEVAA